VGLQQSGIDDDTYSSDYISLRFSIGATQQEAKVGAAALSGRQELTIYNDSNDVIYYGPSGVTTSGPTKGVPIEGLEFVTIPAKENNQVFLISDGTSDVIIQEWA
jgi:hypothetical protein